MRMVFVRWCSMLAAFLWMAQVTFASDIMITNQVARASLTATAKSGAVYLSIMNHGKVEDKLLGVATDVSTAAELHETTMDGDIMKMRAVEEPMTIAAGSTLEMKPGGLHIMLTGLKAPLKKGENLSLELEFEKAGRMRVDVPVDTVVPEQSHGHMAE